MKLNGASLICNVWYSKSCERLRQLILHLHPHRERQTHLYELWHSFFSRPLNTHNVALRLSFFYSWKKKSKTSRERRPRLAGTYRRVWTGESNFLAVQTPGFTWGSRRGQDTCAVLHVTSLQRALLLQVFTPNIYLFQIFTGASNTLSKRSEDASEEPRYSRSDRKRHDMTLMEDFNFVRWALAQSSNIFTINNQWFIRCDIYSYYKYMCSVIATEWVSNWSWNLLAVIFKTIHLFFFCCFFSLFPEGKNPSDVKRVWSS